MDATIIGAPSSTKNVDKVRDPDMHQTRKGQQWYFGMKLHIDVDSVVNHLWGFPRCATRVFTTIALADIYPSRERLMAQVPQRGLQDEQTPSLFCNHTL